MKEHRELRIQVPVLARVEGEGALDLHIRAGVLEDLALRIFEPPRLFERFLVGREHTEIPDIVARICGICPVAYQMSAVHAIEGAFGAGPSSWVRAMRRVLYCGEWIESHALHIHLLAAPDFLGADSVVGLAQTHPAEVRRGLRLQELGNDLIRLLGGRAVHPVGVRPGGFYRAPRPAEVTALLDRLRAALPEADALVAWTASLDLPERHQEFVSVALRHPDEYPMNEGRLVSDDGLDIDIAEYPAHFRERHEKRSTALHSAYWREGISDGTAGRPYLVGPLARMNLNQNQLPPEVIALLEGTSVSFPSSNPFHGIVARALEIRYALGEATRLLDDYRVPDSPAVPVTPRAATGFGCSEAPRGILWHRYEFDADGRVLMATIVPPTSQNQARIEEDLRLSLAAFGLDRAEEELRRHAETVIRNYDPCISCATHFLRLRIHGK
jgi:coenzyme F420-reducing hydrogenase alpha subunit